MTIALLIARLVLTVVFLVSGLAKLFDLKGSRQALIDFGVPAALAPPGGLLLPLAELVVALALLPLLSAWWAAIGALALLLLFIIGMSVNLARGRRPDCHCFGQLSSKPIGWSTLVRNLLLAAVAAFIVVLGRTNAGLSAFTWFGALNVLERIELVVAVVLAAVLVGEGWLLFQMLRQQGRLLLRLEELEERIASGSTTQPAPQAQAAPQPGLPVGSVAPAFALPGLYGETITLDFLRASGKPAVLLFSDPGCGPCNSLMPEVGRWQHDYVGKLTLALISRGAVEANRGKASEHSITQVLLQQDREVAESYQAQGTPAAVVVRPDGTIGTSLALGADAIRALVAGAAGLPMLQSVPTSTPQNGNGKIADLGSLPIVNASAPAATSKIGTSAPDFSLPALSGMAVSLADFRGSRTLLLFWNPGCGYCQQMLDDLRAWEAHPPTDAPKLLVVSTGSTQENQALGLHAPVLLDANMNVGSKFGAMGTPMAVLIDAQGNIASEVAAGAPAVLALAGAQEAPALANGQAKSSGVVATATRGDTAPAFSLPNLQGKRVNLSDFRGSRVLVLFWDPGCGFCQRMLDDLKTWEAHPPTRAPKLVVVSTGEATANRVQGLRSPILLDQNMSVGNKFGASGTPMAVLVDAQGNIASDLAVGAPAVLALAGAGKDSANIVSL